MKKRLTFNIIIIPAIILFACQNTVHIENCNDPWTIVPQIIDSIGDITFPNDTISIVDFGAKPDGISKNTQAFAKAIEACSLKGGGVVKVPSGKFLTGAIHLKSNVNLYLEKEAEILFSNNATDFYPLVHTSWEGTELMNYSPLIYAYNCSNIAITGQGVLNGQANKTNWWPWCGSKIYGWEDGMPSQNDLQNRPRLEKLAEEGASIDERVFGEGHFLRPSFIQPFGCNKVLVQGVKIINAPFWIIHPIKCTNVIIDGVQIVSHGPNNDGCNPEYSKNVLIRNSLFNTGDDCIAIKAGRNADGRRVGIKSENIIVQNCKMIDGHGGVVIGSEISAGVRNVFAENCIMSSPELDRAIRIKTNSKRGGIIENIYARNIEVGQVKEAVLKLNMFYNVYGNQVGDFIPVIRNVCLENFRVKDGGKYGVLARGYQESPIENVTLKNIIIEKVDSAYSIQNGKNFQFIETYINGQKVEFK
jgi:polygalacturonase